MATTRVVKFGPPAAAALKQDTVPKAAPKADPKAAKPAVPKAAPKECAEFNRTGNPCSRGTKCRDQRCRDASAKVPKSAVKSGDGGVSAQLSAMQSQLSSMHTKVDGLTKQVETGFTETKSMLTEQQQVSLGMQKAMEAMMLASASLQSSVHGLITGSVHHRELPSPPVRPAICAPAGSRSTVTEVVERTVARGGGSSASEAREPKITGTHMDAMTAICSTCGFPSDGNVYNVLCALFGTNPVSDHHKSLLSAISDHTKKDALAALLFLILTGSQQFTKSSFNAFRTECDTLLGSNLESTFTTFSSVCESFIKKSPKWEIKKKDSVKASNMQLKEKSQHRAAFDALVTNFQS